MEKIVVYSSDSCKYCHLLKDYLNKNNIEYEEKNISTDPEARTFLMKKNIMGVPATFIGDETIIGFDKDKLDKILGL